MGGLGSGNHYRFSTKQTVEDSLVLSMRDFRTRLFHGAAGTFTWTRASGKSSIGYFVSQNAGVPAITLHYRWHDTEDVTVRSILQSTPTQFGGCRWWFTCPLAVQGVACKRRVGKLYLPAGGRYFGCRVCHDLTYRSCQESHQAERVLGKLGFDREVVRLFTKRSSLRG